jgi:uncharacterized RDD family membrane protein YckC
VQHDHPVAASLWRRLGALLYDAIAVLALIYFAAFVPVVANGGRALPAGNELFGLYLLAVWFGYFASCWTRGRTLGMQAWNLELVSTRPGGAGIGLGQACVRFIGAALALAPFGLGYLAACWDREGSAWHDRWSRTRLVRRSFNASGDAG